MAAGNTYFVADDPVYSWREVFDEIAKAQGVTVRPRRFPMFVATACAFLDEFLARLDLYAMDLHLAGEAARHMGCSIEQAKAVLGYRPITDLSRGMIQAVTVGETSSMVMTPPSTPSIDRGFPLTDHNRHLKSHQPENRTLARSLPQQGVGGTAFAHLPKKAPASRFTGRY